MEKGKMVEKKIASAMTLSLLVIGALALAIKIQPARAAGTIVVPDDYPTIQAAINAANSGNTIYVRNGIYNEYLELNKTVKLTGESNQNTIIEPNRGLGDYGVYITASNVTVENFNITGISPGIDNILIDASSNGSSDNVIRNNNLACVVNNQSGGVDIAHSTGNIVEGNQIIVAGDSDYGIALVLDADNNTVNNNTVIGGYMCITIEFAENNTVSNNLVTGQTLTWWSSPDVGGFPDVGAIHLAQTSKDVVTGNTLNDNSIGLACIGVEGCSVYHNNFINNTQQVLTGNQIVFDNGYPSGGNYWSDYNGTDSFNGPGQNITGSDRIGDTPYVVNANNLDNYPLMSQWTHTNIAGDLNGDGKVNLQDIQVLMEAYNSKLGDSNWNPAADLAAPYGIIGLTDLLTMAVHYGQHYP